MKLDNKNGSVEPQNFYSNNDYADHKVKERVFANVMDNVANNAAEPKQGIDKRSFSFGFAFALLVLFAAIGMYKTAGDFLYGNPSERIIISGAYSKAANSLEQLLPANYSQPKEGNGYGLYYEKAEHLKLINSEIMELEGKMRYATTSKVEEKRLIKLYKLKMQILESLISLEEKDEEDFR